MHYFGKLPSEHLRYFVLHPLKYYYLHCLTLGHMARPGVEGLSRLLGVIDQITTRNAWIMKVPELPNIVRLRPRNYTRISYSQNDELGMPCD